MIDPVVAADGHTYERAAIEEWLKHRKKSKQILQVKTLLSSQGQKVEKANTLGAFLKHVVAGEQDEAEQENGCHGTNSK